MKKLKLYLVEMRIHNYIKNILIFVPVTFANTLFAEGYFLKVLLAFLVFSLSTSFVYIINDIVDYKKDAAHPVKCMRPIASGQIPIPTALIFAFALLVFSAMAAFFLLDYQCFIVLGLYIGINLWYSFKLKHIPILDVFSISFGFILRLYMGACVIDVPLSHWLLLTVFSLSLLLAFGKRRNEMMKVSAETRTVLKAYNHSFLDKSMYAMVSLCIVFYALWSIDPTVVVFFNTQYLVLTVPIVALAIFRYLLVLESDSHGDPTEIILHDSPLLMLIGLYVAVIMALIYF